MDEKRRLQPVAQVHDNLLDGGLLPLTLMSVGILSPALSTGSNEALYTGRLATSFPRTTRLEQALIHLFLLLSDKIADRVSNLIP